MVIIGTFLNEFSKIKSNELDHFVHHIVQFLSLVFEEQTGERNIFGRSKCPLAPSRGTELHVFVSYMSVYTLSYVLHSRCYFE